jgi:hypothetical protein
MIKGSVTDVSPGTNDAAIKLRFPNGVPAVSDESQSDWMLYVYKQFAQPTDATGVPVSIDATDPNGNYVHLGDVVSDSSGRFHYEFTPTMEGEYVIYATFMGSDSYYGSYAQNEMTVMQAEAAPTQTPITMPPFEMYTIGTGIAVIVAVAIVGLLLLRKRP